MARITLDAIREACGYTLLDVARSCRVDVSVIYKYEHGADIPLDIGVKLCRLYNIPADCLMW